MARRKRASKTCANCGIYLPITPICRPNTRKSAPKSSTSKSASRVILTGLSSRMSSLSAPTYNASSSLLLCSSSISKSCPHVLAVLCGADNNFRFTGTDSLNYYAPRIFNMIGVGEGSNSLLTTGIYGVVKFVTTIFYVAYLVDRIGRRLPLIVGALMQATAMLYLALYLRFAAPAADGSGGTPAGGIVGVVFIYIYAFGWSFGHSVACYVVAAEIFPTRIRSFCMSICFFINWIVDYGITRATPNMLSTMGWGTFLLYAVLTYIGVVFVYFCMPETKVSSLFLQS
jgi:hypothetical protein